jgi:huntingtin-interacting protein 1-related protein
LTILIYRLNAQIQSGAGDSIKVSTLNQELNTWKQKYEALAKLYAQLRKEHLDLLQKFKTVKDQGGKVSEDARRKLGEAESALKVKSNELNEILVDRNRIRGETDLVRNRYEEELRRLRGELDDSKKMMQDLSSSRGDEVQSLVAKFSQEQAHMESIIGQKQKEIQELTMHIGDLTAKTERDRLAREEENMVLQSGLDQALGILKLHQDESQSGMSNRDERISILEEKHRNLVYQMMGNLGFLMGRQCS